eukprot:scaffold1779_cov71-Phaeocystis_antarctica.AAC.2
MIAHGKGSGSAKKPRQKRTDRMKETPLHRVGVCVSFGHGRAGGNLGVSSVAQAGCVGEWLG